MNDVIERVAKALSIAAGYHPEACSNDYEEEPMWTLYEKDARAAIQAMREPCPHAVAHASGTLDLSQYTVAAVWITMVDEVLK